jgi:hypothetical protein
MIKKRTDISRLFWHEKRLRTFPKPLCLYLGSGLSALEELAAFPAVGTIDLEPIDDLVDLNLHLSIAKLEPQFVLDHSEGRADEDSVVSGVIDGINGKTHEHLSIKESKFGNGMRM